VASLTVGGASQGFCGASISSERNLKGINCHFIRCIDLSAFLPTQSIMIEQQLHPNFTLTYEGEARLTFACETRYINLHFKDKSECTKFYRKVQGCLQNLDSQTTPSNSSSKILVDNVGIADPELATAIEAAEAAREQKPITNGGFLADGLADIIAQARAESANAQQNRAQRAAAKANPRTQGPAVGGMGSARGGTRGAPPRASGRGRGPQPSVLPSYPQAVGPSAGAMTFQTSSNAPPSSIARIESTNRPGSGTVGMPTRRNTDSRVMMARESKVLAWQQKIQRDTSSKELTLKINIIRIGASKTLKFPSSTLVHEVVSRVAKTHNVNPSGCGLFRRSGLRLEDDLTLEEQDVANNDTLELK